MRLASATLLALALTCPSCATVVGTVAGPVMGPKHLHENSAVPDWFQPFAYVLSVPFGVMTGFVNGVAADFGYVASGGEYGADGHAPFEVVWNPMAPWPAPELEADRTR